MGSGEWEDPTAELVEQPPKQGKKSSTPASDLFDTELSTMQVAMSGKELAAAVREAVAHEYRNHKKPAHTAPPPHPAAASNAEFFCGAPGVWPLAAELDHGDVR